MQGQKTLDHSSKPLSLRSDTSSSRHGRQKPKINAEYQKKTLIDKDTTKRPLPKKEVPSRVTLESSAQGGISDAVPLKPLCFVVREIESARCVPSDHSTLDGSHLTSRKNRARSICRFCKECLGKVSMRNLDKLEL